MRNTSGRVSRGKESFLNPLSPHLYRLLRLPLLQITTSVYFEGNAPKITGSAVLADTPATAYYLHGTTGLGVTTDAGRQPQFGSGKH